ncbi:MAG: hypothetical protein PVH19_06160, partial [Planctomycetia bacterium]
MATRNGKTIGQKTFTEPQETLQNIRISGDSINQILAFLEKTLHSSAEIQLTSKGLDAAAEELFEQVQLQADLGELVLSCNLAEAILLMKPNHVNARLYAMGGYRYRCRKLKLISLKRPIFSSDDNEESKKVRLDAALLRNSLMHRWLDQMEYLVRNKQISMARASQLYCTFELIGYRFWEVRRELLPSQRDDRPDPAPLALSSKKVLDYYVRSVLTMMRDYVKDLPMKNDPSLTKAIGYCTASSSYRSDVARKKSHAECEAMKKKKYGDRLKYWPPDSRESQLTCWNCASFMLISHLHEKAVKCYADDPQRYLAFAKELLAFEEACIRGYRTNGLRFVFKGHYDFHANQGKSIVKKNPMICVPELTESYEAMFARLAHDKDPALQFYGMLGNLTLRRLRDPAGEKLLIKTVTKEELAYFKETARLYEELYAFSKKLEKAATRQFINFEWMDGVDRIDEFAMIRLERQDQNLCYEYWYFIKKIKDLAENARVSEPGSENEVFSKAVLYAAKSKFGQLSSMGKVKHISFSMFDEKKPLKVRGTPVRLETHLAQGRVCAWYSPIPNVDSSEWISLMKLDDTTDLVVTQEKLLLMKKPGELETIFDITYTKMRGGKLHRRNRNDGNPGDFIKNVLDDGTYLWVVSGYSGIHVLTRDGRRIDNLNNTRGFSFSSVERRHNERRTPYFYATVESPGKILVVMKTKNSTVIGRVKVEDSKRIVFEPLHLASKTPVEPTLKAFMLPDVLFRPEPWMRLFKYDDGQQWLAVPRTMDTPNTNAHETYSTLWVNIKKPSDVRVDKQVLKCFPEREVRVGLWYLFDYPPLSLSGNRAVGVQYGKARSNAKYPVHLCIITPPPLGEIGKTPASFERFADPQGKGSFNCIKPQFVTQDDQYIFVICPGKKFVQIDKKTLKTKILPVLGQCEPVNHVRDPFSAHHFVSAHYGIIALKSEEFDKSRSCNSTRFFKRNYLYQVKLDDKGPKLSSYFNKVPSEHFQRHAQAMERLVKAEAYVVPWQDSRICGRYQYLRFEEAEGCSIRIDGKTKDLDAAFRALPDVYAIKNLVIDRADVTEKHLETLARCSIGRLALNLPRDKKGYSPLNDKVLQKILKNEKLRHLYIRSNGLASEGFATVENAKNLQAIELFGKRLSGEMFSHLVKAPSLQYLVFQGPDYTDEHLLLLSEMPRRLNLFFYKTKI